MSVCSVDERGAARNIETLTVSHNNHGSWGQSVRLEVENYENDLPHGIGTNLGEPHLVGIAAVASGSLENITVSDIAVGQFDVRVSGC